MDYIITYTLVLLSGYALGFVVKSYLKKKGANLADKEDIEELTSAQEKEKNKKLREHEFLCERKESFIRFLNHIDEFDIYKYRMDMIFCNDKDEDIAWNFLKDADNSYLRMMQAYHQIKIYDDNGDTQKKIDEIYNDAEDYAAFIIKTLTAIQSEIKQIADFMKQPDTGDRSSGMFTRHKTNIKNLQTEYEENKKAHENKYKSSHSASTDLMLALFKDGFHLKKDY
jgi:hypothetical protein